MEITTAKDLNDMMKVMIMRSVVFMGEQHHSYNMEFDDHDFYNRIHLLAFDGDEPIGTMRILKDGDTAKFERLAILPQYRGKGVAKQLLEAGYNYCKAENVDAVCLFCKPELEKYWIEKGYEKVGGDKVLHYKNMELVPIMKRLSTQAQSASSRQAANDEIPAIFKHEKGQWVSRKSSGNTGKINLGNAGNGGR